MYLEANVIHFQGQFQNSLETPLGRKFAYRANPSCKPTDLSRLPSEFRTESLQFEDDETLAKAKEVLEKAGIKFDIEYSQNKEQLASLKQRMVAYDKQHQAYMSATPEERQEKGLQDVNPADKIEGANCTWKAGVTGPFKDNSF